MVPNGHGEQNLYDLTLEFKCGGKVSDVNKSKVGIREYTYNQKSLFDWDIANVKNGFDPAEMDKGDIKMPLQFSCNGKRIFVRGVNWGMDEGNAPMRPAGI